MHSFGRMRSFTFFVLAFDLRGWEETGLEMVCEGGEGLLGFDSIEKGEGERMNAVILIHEWNKHTTTYEATFRK